MTSLSLSLDGSASTREKVKPLQIHYFAWVREKMGVPDEACEVPRCVGTVGELVAWLRERDARGAAAFADATRIRAALDGGMVGLDTPIAGAAELALFPPVTGG